MDKSMQNAPNTFQHSTAQKQVSFGIIHLIPLGLAAIAKTAHKHVAKTVHKHAANAAQSHASKTAHKHVANAAQGHAASAVHKHVVNAANATGAISTGHALTHADADKLNSFQSWLNNRLGEYTAHKVVEHAKFSAGVAALKIGRELYKKDIIPKILRGEKIDKKELAKMFLKEARDGAIWTGGSTLTDIGMDQIGLGMSITARENLKTLTAIKGGAQARNANEGFLNLTQNMIDTIQSKPVLDDETKETLFQCIEGGVELIRSVNEKH